MFPRRQTSFKGSHDSKLLHLIFIKPFLLFTEPGILKYPVHIHCDLWVCLNTERHETTGGHAERTCTIPTDKAILFPVVNTECSYAEFPKLTSESALRQYAVSEQNNVQNAQAKVDGVLLQASQMARVQSPLFSFTFPSARIPHGHLFKNAYTHYSSVTSIK